VIHRTLGRTGIRVSAISFGAGPVSGLMTGDDRDAQLGTVARAIAVGINWFDTAAGYGDGRSETNLGRVLAELRADQVHIATKVRIPPEALDSIEVYVRGSVRASLERLRRNRATLLQLHNGITVERGKEPASITPADVLGPITRAFRGLQDEGLVQHLGLTGTGEPQAMREVIRAGPFETLQVPFNILNPSAGGSTSSADGESDYGNIIVDCVAKGVGVFAIRVFAGGALLGQSPSAHTLRTPFFPLALFERDRQRAERVRRQLGNQMPLAEVATRFVLSNPAVSSALIGFGSAAQVDEVAALDFAMPLPEELRTSIRQVVSGID
jgi:aryl-alcohol dehydrogenase-like predicted oxidoreductase